MTVNVCGEPPTLPLVSGYQYFRLSPAFSPFQSADSLRPPLLELVQPAAHNES